MQYSVLVVGHSLEHGVSCSQIGSKRYNNVKARIYFPCKVVYFKLHTLPSRYLFYLKLKLKNKLVFYAQLLALPAFSANQLRIKKISAAVTPKSTNVSIIVNHDTLALPTSAVLRFCSSRK